MVRGRAISWSYETEAGDGNGAISAARQIARFAPANLAVTLSNWANAPQLSPGQFHFPAMDRVVAIRSNFTFAISMSSSRIANYESINNGNLHGWFTGDGMTYLYLGNLETQFSGDFWPTVDPYHLPGTTVETTSRANAAGEAATTDQNWVGGAQVKNVYGVAGMSCIRGTRVFTGENPGSCWTMKSPAWARASPATARRRCIRWRKTAGSVRPSPIILC
jgi:hyaluronate lyase